MWTGGTHLESGYVWRDAMALARGNAMSRHQLALVLFAFFFCCFGLTATDQIGS